jgi:hypothetical protein
MAATPVPAPVPSPEAIAGYRALLGAWLETHKRYPETARQRGEEGHAVLRFLVDRSGRVVDYAVISSSGYPDPRPIGRRNDARRHSATIPSGHDPAADGSVSDDPLQPAAVRHHEGTFLSLSRIH